MERGTEALKGFADFANKTIEEAIPHVKDCVEFAEEKVKESIPVVKGYVGFAEEKGNESLPLVKRYAGIAEEKLKGFLGFVLEKLNQVTPDFVRDSVLFSVNQAKQHPYLSGCLVLFVWWKSRSAGSGDDEGTKKRLKDS